MDRDHWDNRRIVAERIRWRYADESLVCVYGSSDEWIHSSGGISDSDSIASSSAMGASKRSNCVARVSSLSVGVASLLLGAHALYRPLKRGGSEKMAKNGAFSGVLNTT